MNDTICITGMGVITAYGSTNESFIEAYARGESGIRELSLFQSSDYHHRQAAEVRDYDPAASLGKRTARAHDRVSLLLLGAAHLLYEDVELADIDTRRAHFTDDEVGIVVGTAASLRSVTDFDLQTLRAPEYVTPTQFPNTIFCAPASYTAIRRVIRASCVTLTNGEPSALQSFGLGIDRLLQAQARQMVVGGGEELTEVYALAVQAASSESGTEAPILGEGAALFTLETRETAERRGARCLAEVLATASCFCPDLQRAYESNISRIRKSVGDDRLRAVSHLFSAQKTSLDELTPLGTGAVQVHALYPRFGYVGSLTGGLAVASMLADEAIPEGAVVLITNANDDGNTASVLLRKNRHARKNVP